MSEPSRKRSTRSTLENIPTFNLENLKFDDRRTEAAYVFKYLVLFNIIFNSTSGIIPCLIKEVGEYFLMNNLDLGLLGGLLYFSISIASPICSYLLQNNYEPKLLLIYFIVFHIIVVLTFTSLPSVNALFPVLCRASFGISQAFVSIFGYVWVTTFSTSEQLVSRLGIWQGTSVLASVVGYGLAFCVTLSSVEKIIDDNREILVCGTMLAWRIPFIIVVCAETAMLALFFFYVPAKHLDFIGAREKKSSADNTSSICSYSEGTRDGTYGSVVVESFRRASVIGMIGEGAIEPPTTEDMLRYEKKEPKISIVDEDTPLLFFETTSQTTSEIEFSSHDSCASLEDLDGDEFTFTYSSFPNIEETNLVKKKQTKLSSYIIPKKARERKRHSLTEELSSQMNNEWVKERLRSISLSLKPNASEKNKNEAKTNVESVFKNPIFILLVFAASGLFYVVSGIQFWVTIYLTSLFPKQVTIIRVSFLITAITGPILGLVVGSVSGNYVNTENERKLHKSYMQLALCYGSAACLLTLPAIWSKSLWVIAVSVWGILFFGGACLPLITATTMGILKVEQHTSGASISTVGYNILGYGLSLCLSGYMGAVHGNLKTTWETIFYGGWCAVGFCTLAYLYLVFTPEKQECLNKPQPETCVAIQ